MQKRLLEWLPAPYFINFAEIILTMKSVYISIIVLAMSAIFFSSAASGNSAVRPDKKAWGWLNSISKLTDEQVESYFAKAKTAGIDAVILEIHNGYPVGMTDTTDFTDYDAIKQAKRAAVFAKKYKMELHLWMWTVNRCEKNLRAAHPDWYQVSAEGNSCLDVKLYNREHYRWLCPSRPEVLEYLKARVDELVDIDGIAGIHFDFIRYPDVILPRGLWESRGVFQDKVYPQWDHCYCKYCRESFKNMTGLDPIELQDPSANEQWVKYRYDAVVKLANALADEVHKHHKIASAAVFASPSESRKLVRQDWSRFTHMDILFSMLYYKFYAQPDEWVITATSEGVREMKKNHCRGYLCTGLMVDKDTQGYLGQIFDYAKSGGSKGICIFSIDGADKVPGYWDALTSAISNMKEGGRK